MGRRTIKIALLVAAYVALAAACSSDYPIWIPHNPNADALYRFRKGERIGYIDQTGTVVIPPTIRFHGFNGGDEFHDGRLEIGAGDGVYLDTTGKKVIGKNFYRGWDFSEGLAVAAKTEDGPWGYVNTDGEFAISPRFAWGPGDHLADFSGGLALIEVHGRYGYIDHSGSFVIPPKLVEGFSFNEGYAPAVFEGPCVYVREGPCGNPLFPSLASGRPQYGDEGLPSCKFGFIDKTGRAISDKRYDYALDFSEGLAPVLVHHRWGYIDKTGELVISPQFDKAMPFSDGVGLVKENNLYGFIGRDGSYVIPPTYKWAESFVDGFAVVGSDAWHGPVWYIDHSGHQMFARKFAIGSSFFKGLAHVRLLPQGRSDRTERFEYIDRFGKTVFAYSP